MKTILIATVITFAFVAIPVQSAEGRLLYSQNRRGGFADEFYFSEKQIENSRRWNPQKRAHPPLSMPKAISIARKYLLKKEQTTSVELASITLQSVNRGNPNSKWYDVFYYRVHFTLRLYDHPVCIILMGGTVLEATRGSSKH